MARPLRIQFPGAVYHVTTRGNAKQTVFADESDYRAFLRILWEVTQRYNWLCYAYCLMPNHYHLLIETLDGNLSSGMRHLNGVYTQTYNSRHQRPGHLFQGRFNAIVVDRESHLLELCRYIVLNPVRAGLAQECSEWRWSSYSNTVGITPKPRFLASDWVLANFGTNRRTARRAYQAFVCAGLTMESPWKDVKGGVLLGKNGFLRKLEEHLEEKHVTEEVPKSQRLIARPQIDRIFAGTSNRATRDRRIMEAHLTWGYTLKEIADFLGLHYTTAGKAFRRQFRRMRTMSRRDPQSICAPGCRDTP